MISLQTKQERHHQSSHWLPDMQPNIDLLFLLLNWSHIMLLPWMFLHYHFTQLSILLERQTGLQDLWASSSPFSQAVSLTITGSQELYMTSGSIYWINKNSKKLKRVKGDLVCRIEMGRIRKKNRTLWHFSHSCYECSPLADEYGKKNRHMWLLVWPWDVVYIHLHFTSHPASDISDQ